VDDYRVRGFMSSSGEPFPERSTSEMRTTPKNDSTK
jgi:hypothetical protein